MRILQVCSARTIGGGERHVATLANSLSQRGHQVYVVVAPGSPLTALLSEVPAENVITLRMRNAFDVPSALRLARIIREKKIEVVHAHLARDYPIASLAIRRYAQLVITRHVLFPLNRLHRLTLKRVARVIAVSNAVARRLQARRICNSRKIQVIANGIELGRFDEPLSDAARTSVREKLGVRRPLMAGEVGSLLPIKGHEDFVRAAAIIARRRNDVDFVIVGDNEPHNRNHRKFLERLIKELGLKDGVQIVDWSGDLSRFYGALDVYVSPSHSEAFGLSIVEAMASGRPVVATATEGAKEIIEDKQTGVLVPNGDAESMADAILALLDNVDERSRLGANAREDVHRRFGLERMVEAVEQVYRDALVGR
jgi:glycosyltransferase involved in cell wall biosynthesis